MKTLKVLFELLWTYQMLKYQLKEKFEVLKFELGVAYQEKIKSINKKP
tara:strand:+ start:1597 stop:1740 length:144 start_codon:yes stop_codon:yes gene_type:complete